ncbi:PWWP domain protein, partial [Cooperia oncophora]
EAFRRSLDRGTVFYSDHEFCCIQGPNPTNWKEILVGDVVWVRWRKNEHWPATVYEITDTVPVKVTVFWVNDKTQSTVDYTQVDLFDMAFHIRFDCRRSDPKYVRAVVTALRYVGKMGFWESFLTKKVYEELVKEEGPTFCQHISNEEIKRIMCKQAKQAKLSKEMKKEDQV